MNVPPTNGAVPNGAKATGDAPANVAMMEEVGESGVHTGGGAAGRAPASAVGGGHCPPNVPPSTDWASLGATAASVGPSRVAAEVSSRFAASPGGAVGDPSPGLASPRPVSFNWEPPQAVVVKGTR